MILVTAKDVSAANLAEFIQFVKDHLNEWIGRYRPHFASTIPNCRAYDPAFAFEVAVILDHGMCEMLVEQKHVFYYLFLMNENYAQPTLSDDVESGMYPFSEQNVAEARATVKLLGSRAIFPEVLAAAQLLAQDWSIESKIWDVTNFTELPREARQEERWTRLHPDQPARTSYVADCINGDILGLLPRTMYERCHNSLRRIYVAHTSCSVLMASAAATRERDFGNSLRSTNMP